MKKTFRNSRGTRPFLVVVTVLILWPQVSSGRYEPLANDGKTGLYVRSIEQVLRLREDEVDLATGALIVSEHWSDLVHGRRYLSTLDDMALEIRERLEREGLRANFRAIPVINKYLFDELGFKSISEASDPNDLFLHSVLDKKRGYCLSLSILYLSLGERLGLPLYGVVVPGHFFVRYDDGRVRFNIETTGKGGPISDENYMNKFKVPEDDKNIYMISLNKIQTLGCLFNNLGNVYSDTSNLDSAMLALEQAVQVNPTLFESRANLGNVYLKKGRVEDAIYEYRAALEINPNDPKIHNKLANAYTQGGWLDYAVSQYAQALQLDPNFTDAYRNLAIAYCKQEKFEQAAVQLKRALILEPKNADLYRQLGEVYVQMENYEEAVHQYKKGLAIKRDLAEAHLGMGICYNKLGSVDDEIEAYKKALSIKPNMLAALVSLGGAYFGQENYDAAIEQYKRAVRVKPDDAWIRYYLGAAYANKADYDKATAEYLKAVEIDPEMADAHHGLAFGFYNLKKYDLAWKHIKIAEELGADVPKEQLDAIESRLQQRTSD